MKKVIMISEDDYNFTLQVVEFLKFCHNFKFEMLPNAKFFGTMTNTAKWNKEGDYQK